MFRRHISCSPPGRDAGAGDPPPRRDELGLPLPDGLMAELDAADQEHLGQVAQGELVAKPPEHHERDDVARVLGPVQHTAAALVELLAAFAAAEPAIALGRALRSLRPSRRTAVLAPHSHHRPSQRGGTLPAAPPADQWPQTGAIPDRTLDPAAAQERLL